MAALKSESIADLDTTSIRPRPESRPRRPSFTEYWKHEDQAEQARQHHTITFINNDNNDATASGPSSSSASAAAAAAAAEKSAQEKAKARRAQVRRAQIKHRQRKADYTKELEGDIAKLKENIEKTQRESRELRGQNEVMKRKMGMMMLQHKTRQEIPRSFGAGFEKSLGAGMELVRSPPPPSTTVASLAASSVGDAASVGTWSPRESPLAFGNLLMDVDVDMGLGDMVKSETTPLLPALPAPDSPSSSGESSNLEMSTSNGIGSPGTAPSTITEDVEADSSPKEIAEKLTQAQTDLAVNFILCLEHSCWKCPSSSPTSFEPPAPTTTLDLPPQPLSPSSTLASPSTNLSAQKSSLTNVNLTLASLHGLASTLNATDKELAPVQAWFEIVRSHGLEVGLRKDIVDKLAKELRGVVKCLRFGAVIERDAFENVVGRVVGERQGRGIGMTVSVAT